MTAAGGTDGADFVQTAIRETESHGPQEYRRRVRHLALAYTGLFAGSIAGIALLIWQAQLYVTLSQRSNVETLTLAFLFVFFAYVAYLSAGGAWGALRIAYYAIRVRVGGDHDEIERQKARTLASHRGSPPAVALNMVLEREREAGGSFRLAITDTAGAAGQIEIDGAEVRHLEALSGGSNSLLAFFVHQVNQVLQESGREGGLDIVTWKKIDDEQTEQHLGLVRFARNLERHLGAEALWPKRKLTDEDCRELERRLSEVCPALRNEAFLPDWEYEARHQLPLIPEPLGLISLQRTERRVDPVASMGCAVLVVAAVVLVLAVFIVVPPWVPGK
jgi:hypothetical protein